MQLTDLDEEDMTYELPDSPLTLNAYQPQDKTTRSATARPSYHFARCPWPG